MTYASPKVNHDPEWAYRRGKMHGMLGINESDFLPCKCDKCRARYLAGRQDGMFLRSKNEHGKAD